MHEYSLVEALIEKVRREASLRGATAVRKLAIRIGDASGVERELFRTAFEVLAPDSPCRGAVLEIRRVPAVWCCPLCGRAVPEGEALDCPEGCDAPARLASGDELMLDRIELEVAGV